jgi:hypothetical protein
MLDESMTRVYCLPVPFFYTNIGKHEKCPWVMPAFSPAWTLTRLSLQDKDNLHNL